MRYRQSGSLSCHVKRRVIATLRAMVPSGRSPSIQLHEVLAALADPVRLEIVRQLASRGEVPCGGFHVDLAKSTLSHHFKVLREAGLVGARAEGTSVMNYLERDSIDRQFPGLLEGILGCLPPPRRRRRAT